MNLNVIIGSAFSLMMCCCSHPSGENPGSTNYEAIFDSLRSLDIGISQNRKLSTDKLMDASIVSHKIVGYSVLTSSFVVHALQQYGEPPLELSVGPFYAGNAYAVVDSGIFFPSYGDNTIEFISWTGERSRQLEKYEEDIFYASRVLVADKILVLAALNGVYLFEDGRMVYSIADSCSPFVSYPSVFLDRNSVYIAGMRRCSDRNEEQFEVLKLDLPTLEVKWSSIVNGSFQTGDVVVGGDVMCFMVYFDSEYFICGLSKANGAPLFQNQVEGPVRDIVSFDSGIVFNCEYSDDLNYLKFDGLDIVQLPIKGNGRIFKYNGKLLMSVIDSLCCYDIGTGRYTCITSPGVYYQVISDSSKDYLLIDDVLYW